MERSQIGTLKGTAQIVPTWRRRLYIKIDLVELFSFILLQELSTYLLYIYLDIIIDNIYRFIIFSDWFLINN